MSPGLAFLTPALVLIDRLELGMYYISELTDRIFSQESEVPIQESGESTDMPLARIFYWKILRARRQDLLECRHDLDLANIRVVIVVAAARRLFPCDKRNGLLTNLLLRCLC
jgi:hypothetical protein